MNLEVLAGVLAFSSFISLIPMFRRAFKKKIIIIIILWSLQAALSLCNTCPWCVSHGHVVFVVNTLELKKTVCKTFFVDQFLISWDLRLTAKLWRLYFVLCFSLRLTEVCPGLDSSHDLIQTTKITSIIDLDQCILISHLDPCICRRQHLKDQPITDLAVARMVFQNLCSEGPADHRPRGSQDNVSQSLKWRTSRSQTLR